MKLPAMLTGGSIATSAGLLIMDMPAGAAMGFALAQLAAFAMLTWSLVRRQRQSQQSAIELVRELRDQRVSIVIRTDGQLEITPLDDGQANQ